MMLVVIGIAVIGPFVASKSPTAFATIPFSHPSAADPLGGDTLGRDVLSRVLHGGWVLLVMALAATASGVLAGVIAGVGQYHLAARRAVILPLLGAITIATLTVVLGPWPFHARLALLICLLGAMGCILAELTVPWQRVSQNAYLLLPASGVLVIGVAMWLSGGWSSPFAPDILLPVIFAAIVAVVVLAAGFAIVLARMQEPASAADRTDGARVSSQPARPDWP